MDRLDQCLERPQIQRFLNGNCADDQAELIADHLGRCDSCSAIATEIIGQSDTIVRLARSLDDGLETESAWKDLRHRLLGSSPALLAQLPLPLALGQYDLIEPIGQGGMGRVFKARQRLLKRSVAVKLLSPDRADDPDAVANFLHEMEVIGSLDHPHIVSAVDADCVDGVYFLVMDYEPGLDLSRLQERLPRLTCADACEMVRQAAVGLQYAHENGLVHCDIKPSNLILTDQGVVKVLDLGLARFQHRESHNSILTVAGTVDYMAPEQWSARLPVDIRADIYALGCTLFKLLVGVAPYEKAGAARRAAHESAPIPDLATLRPDLPLPLAGVVRRMLAKLPADRFSQPRDVVEALSPFCRGSELTAVAKQAAISTGDTVRMRGIAETLVGGQRLQRLRRLGAKRAWMIILGLALGLTFIGGAIMALIRGSEHNPGWQAVSLSEPRSFVSRDVNCLVSPGKVNELAALSTKSSLPLFIPMGSATRLPFSLKTSIAADFNGEAGLYFGFANPLGDGSAPHTYQALTLVRNVSLGPNELWLRYAAYEERHGITVQLKMIKGKWPVKIDESRHFQTLEVAVRERNLQFKWNGENIPPNAAANAEPQPDSGQYAGAYGLFLGRGEAVFGGFQMNTSESEK
jgi:hypothetical protein